MAVDDRRARMPDWPADHACGSRAFAHRVSGSRGRAAIDSDRGALDVPRLFRAKEQGQRGNILRLAEPADAVLGGGLGLQLIDRLAGRLGAHFDQLVEALGLGRAGMNDVDVDAVLLALLRQRLGEIAHRGVDRSADREIGAGRARRAAADVDDKAVRRLQHRPERAAHPHAAEQFQRVAVHPGLVRQVDEIAGLGRAGRIDQDVAAAELFLHRIEHLLDALELAQVRGDRERRRPTGRADGLGRGREVGIRRRHDHRLRAGLGELDRDLAADAAAAAGDDHHFSLKLACHHSLPCTLV